MGIYPLFDRKLNFVFFANYQHGLNVLRTPPPFSDEYTQKFLFCQITDRKVNVPRGISKNILQNYYCLYPIALFGISNSTDSIRCVNSFIIIYIWPVTIGSHHRPN